MSNRTRNLLSILLIFLLAGSAFTAGFVANDFFELRSGGTLVRETETFDLFWEAWERVEGSYLGELPDERTLTYSAIRGALTGLDDPYTVFVEPVAREQERQTLQGSYGGIGAALTRPEGRDEVVLEPIPGNPAEAAGIQSGDVLLAVDGETITADLTVQAVAELIRGEKGTVVVLTVRHPGEDEPVDIAVERTDILIPSVSARLLAEDETLGYIQLSRFSGESGGEIETAVSDLTAQGATALVLDLRGNGGGLVDAAVDVADHFLREDTLILTQISRDEGERTFAATANTLAPDVPLVVLVDGGTASAAEILAGALQDQARALLVGSGPTFGKGSVQLVYDLSDGSSVHVTASRWFTPDGQQLDQQGLTPDLLVEVTPEDIENGRDAVLNRAITYLQTGQ